MMVVVMDKPQHTNKAWVLLEDAKTYQEIKFNSAYKYKKRVINLLKKINAYGGIKHTIYKKMYPTGAALPKFYGLPKIHKRDIPFQHIVSSRGTTTYEAAKGLARILRPLVGKSSYHTKSTKEFVDQIHDIQFQKGGSVSL